MALSKADHAQIKLAVMEGVQAGMHAHRDEEHKPLCRRVEAMERKVWWATGAGAVAATALGWLIKVFHTGKIGG